MNTMNDDLSEKLAKEYDLAQQEGQKFIAQTWSLLNKTTKEFFVASDIWNGRGIRRKDNEDDNLSEIGSLEYHIGILQQASKTSLPDRSKPDADIPYHVFLEDIVGSCEEILFRKELHDPVFIRLALRAIRVHEMAKLLRVLPTVKELGLWWIPLAFIQLIIVLASPFIISAFFVAIASKDISATATIGYLIAVLYAFHWNGKRISNQVKKTGITSDEITYNAWWKLNEYSRTGGWLAAGVGARVYLEQAIRDGGNIPPIVFDLLALLEDGVKNE